MGCYERWGERKRPDTPLINAEEWAELRLAQLNGTLDDAISFTDLLGDDPLDEDDQSYAERLEAKLTRRDDLHYDAMAVVCTALDLQPLLDTDIPRVARLARTNRSAARAWIDRLEDQYGSDIAEQALDRLLVLEPQFQRLVNESRGRKPKQAAATDWGLALLPVAA